MAKVTGFLSQEVTVTRPTTPDGPPITTPIPPEWQPLLNKILAWYDNQNYPTWATRFFHNTRAAQERNREKSVLPIIKPLWAALDSATKLLWSQAAEFVKKNGYQLFVKDCSYRIKNGLDYPRAPSTYFQTHGLKVSNPGGSGQVRFQRDDVLLTGPITISFNYKKEEIFPPLAQSFRFEATAWYFQDGLNKTETLAWESPTGNVNWNTINQSFGTADRLYFHFRIIFYLDDYDADVYFTDFLIEDKTRTWSVDYTGNVLPEDASPAWVKSGDLTEVKIAGSRLHLKENADSVNSVLWSRTPSFINVVGGTVWLRLKIVSGTEKDSGQDNYVFSLTHSDGTYRADLLFYTNGFALKIGGDYFVYHLDMSKFRTIQSVIKDNLIRVYISGREAYRETLTASGGQEVSFGAFGRVGHDVEVWVSRVAYYHGEKWALEDEVLREGFWFLAGKTWEVENLYRKQGWTFSPDYCVPNFEVVYLG